MGQLELINLSQFWSYDVASTEDEMQARARFTELFKTSASKGVGGSGQVIQVQNAFGETFALKTPYLDFPADMDKAQVARNKKARIEAFKQEYKNQATFCRSKNFPKVYGLGEFNATPAMLMEWIDGGTITKASALKAFDPKREKVAPQLVAKIGVKLLEMIENLQYKDEAFVHRDISANNIMFRTKYKSIAQQVKDDDFDLCLIDFGSSHAPRDLENPSFTQILGFWRGATPEYAAPEMLTHDLADLDERRKSVKIDSYAICSVLYELLSGQTPYDLKDHPEARPSYFRFKLDNRVSAPTTLHASSSVEEICKFDKFIASVFESTINAENALQTKTDNRWEQVSLRFSEALNKVDAQLGLILLKGLNPDQEHRASPTELKLCLSEFLKNYAKNITFAYFGQSLLPFAAHDDAAIAEIERAQQPVMLMQAQDNPTHLIVAGGQLAPDLDLLFEKEKKKYAFSKGIFAFGLSLCAAVAAIVAVCLDSTLYATPASASKVVALAAPSLFLLLIAPVLISGIAFLITPKKGSDLIVGSAFVIAITIFAQYMLQDWDFVSDYVSPVISISQIALALIFVITICASRREV